MTSKQLDELFGDFGLEEILRLQVRSIIPDAIFTCDSLTPIPCKCGDWYVVCFFGYGLERFYFWTRDNKVGGNIELKKIIRQAGYVLAPPNKFINGELELDYD